MQAPGGFFVSARLQAAAISLFLIVPLGGIAAIPAAAQTPAQVGQWEGPLTWPWVSIHMMLLPNGQVLFWDGPPEDGGHTATLWNPATGGFIYNAVSDKSWGGQCRRFIVTMPDGSTAQAYIQFQKVLV